VHPLGNTPGTRPRPPWKYIYTDGIWKYYMFIFVIVYSSVRASCRGKSANWSNAVKRTFASELAASSGLNMVLVAQNYPNILLLLLPRLIQAPHGLLSVRCTFFCPASCVHAPPCHAVMKAISWCDLGIRHTL
jgi:hypothetical protein